jgi:hypothetical protein
MNADSFLSKTEQDRLRAQLGKLQTVSDYLASASDHLADGKGLAEAVVKAAPWLKDVAFLAKLGQRWAGTTDPYELGAAACTIAYQQAARTSSAHA